jgi:ribosomal protein S20
MMMREAALKRILRESENTTKVRTLIRKPLNDINANLVEKARRLFIDAKIRELGFLLPKKNEA